MTLLPTASFVFPQAACLGAKCVLCESINNTTCGVVEICGQQKCRAVYASTVTIAQMAYFTMTDQLEGEMALS